MNIAIRADASVEIGTGHVMRCLTLAEALYAKGAEVCFICSSQQGNMIELIQSKGFPVFKLLLEEEKEEKGSHACASAKENWQEDATQTLSVLGESVFDWLVVDHYSLDIKWERRLRQSCKKLMVIDDLANREHDCDLLLDQTYGRRKSDYQGLVPLSCILLLGSHFALLRQEFCLWRSFSLSRRQKPELKNVLISFGGGDPENLTARSLSELAESNIIERLKLTIVMGQNAQLLQSIKKQVSRLSINAEILSAVDNMAELMANNDLALGGLGTTSWERCCLGVPTLGFVLAENQQKVAAELEKVGAIKKCSLKNLRGLIEAMNPKELKAMSDASYEIVDGKGSIRVSERLVGFKKREVSLKAAQEDDCEFFFSLQNEDGARTFSLNKNVPTWSEHISWYSKVFKNDDVSLFKVVLNELPVGMLRLDNLSSDCPEVSIIISNRCSGLGIATSAIEEAKKRMNKLRAQVHVDNLASKKVFIRAGFKFFFLENEFITLIYED